MAFGNANLRAGRRCTKAVGRLTGNITPVETVKTLLPFRNWPFAARVIATSFQNLSLQSADRAPEREVITDRAIEAWYHLSIA
jgi:hypothetical protein